MHTFVLKSDSSSTTIAAKTAHFRKKTASLAFVKFDRFRPVTSLESPYQELLNAYFCFEIIQCINSPAYVDFDKDKLEKNKLETDKENNYCNLAHCRLLLFTLSTIIYSSAIYNCFVFF